MGEWWGGKSGYPNSVIANEQFFFLKPGLTWSTVPHAILCTVFLKVMFLISNGSVFGDVNVLVQLLGLMNSVVFEASFILKLIPLNFQSGEVAKVPFIKADEGSGINLVISNLVGYLPMNTMSQKYLGDFSCLH